MNILHWVKFLIKEWKKKNDKKDGVLKRLRAIEEQNKMQKEEIENRNKDLVKSIEPVKKDDNSLLMKERNI